MPAPPPSLFGRFGTVAHLEKEARKAEQFSAAVDKATDSLKDMYSEGAKNAAEQKKRHAEVAAAIDHVSKALQGTTKNADKYGKAVERDAKIMLDFAKQNKLTFQEASNMYDRVIQKQGLLSKGFSWGLDKLKSWGSVAATIGATMHEYRKRLDEIHTGHQLFLSDTALTGPAAKGAFKDTQKYVDGYREAIRNVEEVSRRWGVSADEAKTTTQALAFSLRGQVKDVNRLGNVLQEDTDLVYGFAKVMNVDASSALAYFRNQMRVQGKTHEQARKSLDTVIAGYDNLRVKVGDAAAPLKEEYLATLQQIRQEMGPTQVSTAAMTAAMNMMAEGAKRAGLSAKGVSDAMAALPKIGQNLTKYHKMQLGAMIGYNDKMLAALPEKLRTQVQAIKDDPDMMIWEKKEIIANLTAGSKVGIKALFGMIRKAGVVEQNIMLKGLTDQQKVAFVMMKKLMREGKTYDEAVKVVEQRTKEAGKARKTLPEALRDHTTGLDSLATKVYDLEKTTKKLMDQYSTLVAPAMGALTLALNAGNLVQSMRNLSGGLQGAAGSLGQLSGAAGKAGAAGALIGVGVAAYQLGTYLDKTFQISDKISDAMVSTESKISQLKRSAGRGHEFLAGQTERIAETAQRIQKYGRAQISEQPGGKIVEATAASVRSKEIAFLKHSMKQGDLTQKQFDVLVKALDKQLEKFPKPKKTETAKQEGERQRVKAEARAKVGEAALKSTGARDRAKVPPAAAKAPAQRIATPAVEQSVPGAEAAPASQFDPAMGTFTSQMTISANDPNWQQFFQMNQSIMNQGKRSR